MIPDADYAEMLFRLSDSYVETGDLLRALDYMPKAEKIFLQTENYSFWNCCKSRLGRIHRSLGDLDTALTYFESSNILNEKMYERYPQSKNVKILSDQLHETYPQNVKIKKVVDIAHLKLSNILLQNNRHHLATLTI